jgi:hypothetical protein
MLKIAGWGGSYGRDVVVGLVFGFGFVIESLITYFILLFLIMIQIGIILIILMEWFILFLMGLITNTKTS